MSEPPIDLTKVRASRALVKRKPESSKDDQQKKQPKLDKDYDRKQKLLFKWAERLLQDMGLLDALRQAKTCDEVDAIKLDDGNLTLIMAIQAVLHPSGKKPHERCFEGFNQAMLLRFLKSRLEQFKKEQKNKLEEDEQSTAAAEEAREKREEHAQFYGDFKQYKALDSGVFVLVEDLKTESTKWEQISRTRIELLAVTRSKQDDNWGVYVRIINMDGRATCLAIPRSIINDKQAVSPVAWLA